MNKNRDQHHSDHEGRPDHEDQRDRRDHEDQHDHRDEQHDHRDGHHGRDRDDDFHPVQPSRPHGGGDNPSPAPLPQLEMPPTALDLSAEALAMEKRFPGFRVASVAGECCWIGDVTPFARLDEASRIFADLEANRRVGVAGSSALRHLPDCLEHHIVPALVASLGESVSLQKTEKLVVFAPRQSGQPTVFAVGSSYDPRLHPHIYANPWGGLCTRFSPDQDLNRERSTIVQEVEQAIIYIAKQIVWRLTALVGERGHWLGADVGHTPMDYLLNTPEYASCPACNSGRPYKDCCHAQHVRATFHVGEGQTLNAEAVIRQVKDKILK